MITFSIDTMPLSDNILESNDYSSKVIYSSVGDCLFKYNLTTNCIIKNACNSYSYSKNKKLLTIEIRDDLYFYNGDKVTSEDYYKTYKCILNSKTHIGFIFRRFFKDIKILNSNTIQFINRNKNDWSYKILSIYSTCCLKGNYTSGPYYIEKMEENFTLLKRNRYYRKKIHNKEATEIKFLLTDGLNDYKLYSDNKVQITNNTMCNVNNIDKYNYIKEDNYIYLNVIFSLEMMNKNFDEIRNFISKSIQKDRVVKLLNNKYETNDSFIVKFLNNKIKNGKNKFLNIDDLYPKKELTLGYNNFYPNKKIAVEIKKQLELVGFKIVLVENEFNINNDCDLNISLNYLEYISADSLINGSYLCVVLEKHFFYKGILKLYNMTHNKYLLYLINKRLLTLNYKIPVLKMKGYYLKSADYIKFNYVELNYEEL